MHKQIAKELIKKGYLDKVIVVPTADSYNKPYLLNGQDRFKMLKQIFKNEHNVNVSSYEVEGRLYTINTLNYFHEKYPKADLYFICGMDNLAEFYKWRNYEDILKNYKLLVINRDDIDFEEVLKRYKKYQNNIILAKISPRVVSSTTIRNEIIKRGYNKKLRDYLYVDTIKYLKNIDAKQYWR